jgi:Predicted aminoglycoside phosphotransferase
MSNSHVSENWDTKREIALEILKNELNIMPAEVTRFPVGMCHFVYYVKTETCEFVLRVTQSKWHYDGSVKWLTELAPLEIPIPKILKYGQYKDVYYTLITYINGKDLGEVYYTLNDSEKRDIVKELVKIQRKVSTLSSDMIEGSDKVMDSFVNWNEKNWLENIENDMRNARESLIAKNIFDPGICDVVVDLAHKLKDVYKEYIVGIKPVVFLDDITTKNVLIHNGKLAGIVDIDEMGYGDPLGVVAVTNTALLTMGADTKYIDYWLDEMQANDAQKKALILYSLLNCIGFMGERGSTTSNDKVIPVNPDEVERLNSMYHKLLSGL